MKPSQNIGIAETMSNVNQTSPNGLKLRLRAEEGEIVMGTLVLAAQQTVSAIPHEKEHYGPLIA
jgi:phosphosulfolactate phosphohydrolase-like enzyme